MRLTVIVLIGALFWSPLAKTGLWMHYIRNVAAYKAACVNQDKPELSCEGKCQLMAEMAKAGIKEPPVAPLLGSQKEPQKPSKEVMNVDLPDFVVLDDLGVHLPVFRGQTDVEFARRNDRNIWNEGNKRWHPPRGGFA